MKEKYGRRRTLFRPMRPGPVQPWRKMRSFRCWNRADFLRKKTKISKKIKISGFDSDRSLEIGKWYSRDKSMVSVGLEPDQCFFKGFGGFRKKNEIARIWPKTPPKAWFCLILPLKCTKSGLDFPKKYPVLVLFRIFSLKKTLNPIGAGDVPYPQKLHSLACWQRMEFLEFKQFLSHSRQSNLMKGIFVISFRKITLRIAEISATV